MMNGRMQNSAVNTFVRSYMAAMDSENAGSPYRPMNIECGL